MSPSCKACLGESGSDDAFLSPPQIWRLGINQLLYFHTALFWSHLTKPMLGKEGTDQTSFHLENHHPALHVWEEVRGSINFLLTINEHKRSLATWVTDFSWSFVVVSKQKRTNVLLLKTRGALPWEGEHSTSWACLPQREKYVVLVRGAVRSGRPCAGFGSLKKTSIWFSSVSKLKFLKWSQIFK